MPSHRRSGRRKAKSNTAQPPIAAPELDGRPLKVSKPQRNKQPALVKRATGDLTISHKSNNRSK